MMGSYSVHKCDPDGTELGALDGPPFAMPGRVVHLPDVDLYGRVRLWWRCCGAVLVEFMTDLDDLECADTVTTRHRLDEMAMPVLGVSYSVPCVGASWSLNLPCGHITGEGCDCDTIAAEAADQDDDHECGPGIQYCCDNGD
jgi:hypothetical protein